MITIPTVFILGAGASAEYDFPLGHPLVKRIIADTLPPGGDLRVDLLRAGFPEPQLNEFSHNLRDSDPLSIDTFLEGNREEFQAIGKAAIAITILRAEHASRAGEKWMGKSVPDDHWLRYVWNLMRSRCASAEEFAQNNKVSFVTFNYDRAVEWYFQTVLQAAFNIGPREARALFTKSVPVVHLHGQIGADREFGHRGGDHLAGSEVGPIAAGIRVVHDPTDEPQFAKAWELFKEARLVCILGFGYHPVNIERLRLKEFVPRVALAPSTYGMGEAEVRVAWGRIEHSGLPPILPAWRDYKAERFLKEAAQLV